MQIRRFFVRLTALAVVVTTLGGAHAQMAAPAHGQTVAPAQAAAPTPPVNRITGAAPDASWEEEYAYAVGVTAYVHLFPWAYNSLLRWRWATAGLPNMTTPVIEPNVLAHQRGLIDASYKDGGRPNNDTVYSMAWLDLSREPMIIKVPDMGNRFYVIQLVNYDADNFDNIGTRTTGNRAGTYAFVGPNWKGALPPGVKALAPAQTPWIILLARILVDGNEDLPAVQKLQEQISIAPLSQFEGKGTGVPKYTPQPPLSRQNDPLADWKNINRALAENPMPAHESQLAKTYAQIGIGPGLDVEKMSPAVKRGLVRAQKSGAMIVSSLPVYGAGRTFVNGWGKTTPNWGRAGPDGQYLMRASKSLGGWIAVDAEETLYPTLLVDANGEALQDTRRYVLRFEKGQTPPANAFWSITLYGPDYNLVDNPINRYSIGDRTKGLKYDADGSLTLYLQKDAPGGDKNANWLPSGGGNFNLMMRTYMPKPEMLDGRWQPPPARRAD